jgi:hypothetical protein
MGRIKTGLFVGMAAGIVDIIPMILQGLSLDALLGAFSLWIVVGFMIAVTDLKMNGAAKGVLIAFGVLLPSAFIIGRHQPAVLIPIVVMTAVLGTTSGLAIEKLKNRQPSLRAKKEC